MLKGSFVALITPFNQDESVNYDKLKELLEYHLKNNTDGLVILGTTAETETLSMEEQIKIVELTMKIVSKRLPIIIGIGTNNTLEAVSKAKLFSSMGADYLLSVTPYYNKTNEQGLIAHFKAIALEATCPIILYNVPSRTGMNISPKAIEELAKDRNIIGIKEASGNISYAAKIAKYLSDDFVMLSGNDDIIVPIMSLGGSGVISVLANICPKNVHNLCKLCLDNDFISAGKLQSRLNDVAESLFYETNPIPVKEALNYLGFKVGGYRLPLYPMEKELKDKMIQVLIDNSEVII